MVEHHDRVSYRTAASKFRISASYAHKIIKNKSVINKRKKIKISVFNSSINENGNLYTSN